jgi:hypothetical protein
MSCIANKVGIQIRVIRDNNNSLHDEVYTIRRGSHNDYEIVNRSAFSDTETTMFLKTSYMVVHYIQNLLELLKLDSDKFRFIQFDASCYPVVMVSRHEFLRPDTAANFVRVVDSVLTNWPSYCEPLST